MSQLYSKTPNVEEHLHLLSSFKYLKNSSMENKVISQETISAIELHLTEGDILGANSVITAALKEIDNTPLNIAVTGESGTGKSSFINALRGVGHESKEAAPIGVCETTMEKKLYCHPAFPNVRVWDLPGIGTINFQPKDYLKQVQFVEYDFFIIVSSTRFKQNDIDLANVITIMKKNFYFVRTKVDSDLRNEKKCKPSTFNEETVLQTIQNNCLANFKKSNMIEPQIFLISNNNASKFDFPILMDTLINDVPVQKRHIFMLSLPNITEAVTERKWKSLKQHIWLKAFKAGLLTTLPLQGIISIKDKEKLKTRLNYFRVLFGVDDLSLKSLAKDLQVPVEQLKAIIKSPNLLEIDNEETIEEKLWRYVETFCLINGGLLATGIYFKKSFCLQLHFLDTVSEDAKVIFRKSYSRQN